MPEMREGAAAGVLELPDFLVCPIWPGGIRAKGIDGGSRELARRVAERDDLLHATEVWTLIDGPTFNVRLGNPIEQEADV